MPSMAHKRTGNCNRVLPCADLGAAARVGKGHSSKSPFLTPRTAREVVIIPRGNLPVLIPNTEVKPRRADCTARESVWESRSLPALNKGHAAEAAWPFPLAQGLWKGTALEAAEKLAFRATAPV